MKVVKASQIHKEKRRLEGKRNEERRKFQQLSCN